MGFGTTNVNFIVIPISGYAVCQNTSRDGGMKDPLKKVFGRLQIKHVTQLVLFHQ